MRTVSNALLAAVGLFLAGFLLLVSGPALLDLVGGGPGDGGPPEPEVPGVSTVQAAGPDLHCGPCGMSMDADSPLVEIAGRRWAVCSERCAELIRADPEAFAEAAVGAGDR